MCNLGRLGPLVRIWMITECITRTQNVERNVASSVFGLELACRRAEHSLLKQHALQVYGHSLFHLHFRDGKQAKIQNKNVCLRRKSNQRPLTFQPDASDCLVIERDVLLRFYSVNNQSPDREYILQIFVIYGL